MQQVSWSRVGAGLLALGLSLVGESALAVPVIDTRPQVGAVGYIGESAGSNTFGQTFVPTGPETELDTFTIWVDDVSSSPSLLFQGFLYSWDGTETVGDALYESETRSSTVTGTFEEFTFSPGLSLVADQEYIFFFTGVAGGTPATGQLGTAAGDVYGSGGLFFTQGPDQPWMDFGGEDLTFVATFSAPGEPVPEPGTLLLLGSGLLAIGRARRWIPGSSNDRSS